MAFSIITLSTKGLYVTLSITMLCHYGESYFAECHILFIVVLIVVMLNVVLLSVIALSVVEPLAGMFIKK